MHPQHLSLLPAITASRFLAGEAMPFYQGDKNIRADPPFHSTFLIILFIHRETDRMKLCHVTPIDSKISEDKNPMHFVLLAQNSGNKSCCLWMNTYTTLQVGGWSSGKR